MPAPDLPAPDLPAVDVVARFTWIITAIGQEMGRHLDRTPKPLWPPLVAVLSPLWLRLSRLRPRFAALVARARARARARTLAGTLPPPRPWRPRPERPQPERPQPERPEAPDAAAPPTRKPRSGPPQPTGFGWLLRFAPVGHYGLKLRSLLAEPEMAALIAQSPQLARLLRPLCHMLAVPRADLPALYPPAAPWDRPDPAQPPMPATQAAAAAPAPSPWSAEAPPIPDRWREVIPIVRPEKERRE